MNKIQLEILHTENCGIQLKTEKENKNKNENHYSYPFIFHYGTSTAESWDGVYARWRGSRPERCCEVADRAALIGFLRIERYKKKQTINFLR